MGKEADIDRPITLQRIDTEGVDTTLETTPRAIMELLGVKESDADYSDIVAFFAGGDDGDEENVEA